MSAIGQKPRCPMQRFVSTRVWFRHRHRLAAAGRHAKKSAAGFPKAKQDNSVTIPRAAGSSTGYGWKIAEHLRWASRHLDLLQLAPGKEGKKPAVGRPEGSDYTLGTGQDVHLVFVKPPDGQSHQPSCIDTRNSERNVPAVRRQPLASSTGKQHLCWRCHGEAN